MLDGLKPYPNALRAVPNEPWLGAVPEHWSVARLKTVCRFMYGDSMASDDRKAGPVKVYGSNGPVGVHEVANTLAPCIVIGRKGSFGKINYSEHAVFAIDTTFFVDSRSTLHNLRWLAHVLGAIRLDVASRDSAIPGLDRNEAYARVLPLPPPAEQAGIVRFLGAVDRKVNRFIRAKRRLIEVLTEQKQAIITHAVTKGLNLHAPLKPSGIDWLGDVPEQWEVKRLKWVVRLQRGYDLPADSRHSGGTVPVVSSGGIIDRHDVAMALAPGIVIGRYGSTEAVFFLEEDYWPHNTALFTTTMHGNAARWCFYLLRSISKADHAGKSAVPGVDRKDLYDIFVPRPPVAEQEQIVGAIDAGLVDIEAAIKVVLREIDLIREFRTRLVADVVTGKVDVRAAAAAIGDEEAAPEAGAAEAALGEADLAEGEAEDFSEGADDAEAAPALDVEAREEEAV